MYYIERKERYVLPNILGNRSFPVYTYRWKIIARCEDKEPLEEMLKTMDKTKYRITNNDVMAQIGGTQP